MSEYLIKKVATGVKFDLLGSNGQVIATSEVYKTMAACRKGIESVRKNAPKAAVEDQTNSQLAETNPKFELYQDKTGMFRFRLRSRNGSIIAVSESYSTRQGCLQGIERVKNHANSEENPIFSGNKY